MATALKAEQIDELLESARTAIDRSAFFEAERICLKALGLARQSVDYERMIRIVGALLEARQGRIGPALTVKRVTIIEESVTEDTKVRTACYLIQPPQVGADARRLRLTALAAEVPAAVLCREPRTMLGLWPIVAISPGVTIRAKVDPPAEEKPDVAWFKDTMVALGDFALETIDPEIEPAKRVDLLMDRLDAIPDHEGLHHALEDACRVAMEAAADPPAKGRGSRR